MKRLDLLTVCRGSTLEVRCDEVAEERLKIWAKDKIEPLALSFFVKADTPFFLNYTDLPKMSAGETLFLSNTQSESHLISGRPVGIESLVSIDEVLKKTRLHEGELLPFPLGVVFLDYSAKKGAALLKKAFTGNPSTYVMGFKSRQSFWRYFIPCDGKGDGLSVVDPKEEVTFAFEGVVAPEGRRVYARFVSQKPLSLQHGAPGRFQLKYRAPGASSGGCRTLIKALPNAPFDPLHERIADGRRDFVSDIYVQHYVYGR
ncbi:MAG: hypothetical protein MI742_13365 [Desulfobacterales bacterium]|nr:hypothetical protein [Desulfobacterales bacterium]